MVWWDDFVDNHPRLATALQSLRTYLPPINFITLHYAYFIVLCLLSSVVFWVSSKPAFSISYVDSLFLTVSAMSEAGLNTVNLSQMTTWQQIMLWLLIMLGSSIWVSIWTVLARKHAFEVRFEAVVRAQRERRLRQRKAGTVSISGLPLMRRLFSLGKASAESNATDATPVVPGSLVTKQDDVAGGRPTEPVAMGEGVVSGPLSPAADTPIEPVDGVGEDALIGPAGRIAFADTPHPNATSNGNHAAATGSAYLPENRLLRRHNASDAKNDADAIRSEKLDGHGHDHNMQHFLKHRIPGRNAQFFDLTREEREQLGGCEYRALKVLAVIVPLYFFMWQILGCIALSAWIATYQPESATGNGINPWWAGIFNGVSAFNNSGMSLLDANMIPFERADFVLITMGLMILAGNTAYPIFLRLIFWSGLKLLKLVTPETALCDLKATIDFILKYPRRVYTNLFPARPTWWLLFMIVTLNCLDWLSFLILDLNNPVTAAIPTGARVLDGLFQALAVRSGGFYVVPIGSLYIGVQILYVIMMYISAFPVVITMRHSNVYEERSLGIYAEDAADEGRRSSSSDLERGDSGGAHRLGANGQRTLASQLTRALQRTLTAFNGVGVPPTPPGGTSGDSRVGFISQQIHGQLAHDIWMLVLAVLVISTIETANFLADPVDYSVFNVILEVVSAYGTVGISVGLPWAAYSFSGGWHAASKLVLCLVMLRGRHRGLPVALDRAVRLPGEQLHREEEEDYRRRRSMTERRISAEI